MSIGMIGDAFSLGYAVVQLIGDARAWRILVREWAYMRANGHRDMALLLESWASEPSALLGNQRREAARMWAFDQQAMGETLASRLLDATELYNWVMEAEKTLAPDRTSETGPGGFGEEGHPR